MCFKNTLGKYHVIMHMDTVECCEMMGFVQCLGILELARSTLM